jgi:Fibronectin type III domain/Beta-propeller repeat
MHVRTRIPRSVAFLAAFLLFVPVVRAQSVSPPTLTATALSSSQIKLSWSDPNRNETGYEVERSLSSTSGFTRITTTAPDATSFTSSGLAAGTRYYYRIRAVSKTSYSAYSNTANAVTGSAFSGGAPVAPSNLAAAGYSSSQINLSWRDNSTNETAFVVERAPASTGPFTQIGSTAASGYGSSGLAPSTTYWYRVRAYNSSGYSAYSNTASATTLAGGAVPAAPTSLSATAASTSQINLAWVDASSNETGFRIERSTSTSPWAEIATVAVNVRTYSSTGLAGGTTYSYRVRSYNTSGNSGYSNGASATTTGGSGGGSTWSKWYAGAGSFGDVGKAVDVDPTGNVIVAGQYQGIVNFGTGSITSYTNPTSGPTVDSFVAKYSASGSAVWSRSMGGDQTDSASGVATDSGGNVLVTGYQASASADYGAGLLPNHGVTDVFLAKYTPAGGYVWAKTVGGSGADAGSSVATDSSGSVFVTGYMGASVDFGGGSLVSAGGQDVFLVKYSSAGAHLWSKRFGSTGADLGTGVATDSSGNVVVVGTFTGSINLGGGSLTSAGGRDMFVAKFSATGLHVWSKRFGGTGNDDVRGVAVDGSGNVVVTGQFLNSLTFGGTTLTSAGVEDIFLAKLSGATGGHVWSQRFGSSSAPDFGYGVAVDGNGNVAMTGYFAGLVNFGGGGISAQMYDIFVAKYTSAGTYVSARRYGDPAGLYDNQYGYGIAMSGSGSMYVTGSYLGTLSLVGQATAVAYGGSDGVLASIGP